MWFLQSEFAIFETPKSERRFPSEESDRMRDAKIGFEIENERNRKRKRMKVATV